MSEKQRMMSQVKSRMRLEQSKKEAASGEGRLNRQVLPIVADKQTNIHSCSLQEQLNQTARVNRQKCLELRRLQPHLHRSLP